MSPGLGKFFIGFSWLMVWVGVIGTILMAVAVIFSPGPAPQKILSMVPAAIVMLVFSGGVGAMLRVLVSIDTRLAHKDTEG